MSCGNRLVHSVQLYGILNAIRMGYPVEDAIVSIVMPLFLSRLWALQPRITFPRWLNG
jgi:hypothetical protein